MKPVKGKKYEARNRRAKVYTGNGRAVARPQLADSDDDLEDILPTLAVAAGSSAYEALLGGLDRALASRSADVKAKASKVKTQTTSAVGAQPHPDSTPAEQPLHESNTPASSSDDDGDRSEDGAETPPHIADAVDHTPADFFSQHFGGSTAELDGAQSTGHSLPVWREDSQARCPWPSASWLVTGSSVPQVKPLAMCVPSKLF